MSEDELYCSKCNNFIEQALMLCCEHNLCLPCAAQTLNNQKIKDFNSSQLIKCEVCNMFTEVEPETLKQILSEQEGYDNNQNYDNENYVIDNLESNDYLDLEDNNIKNNSSIVGNQKNNKYNK